MIVELDDHSSFVFSHYYKRWQCIKLFKCFDSRSLGGEELLLLIFLIFFFVCDECHILAVICSLFELCVRAICLNCAYVQSLLIVLGLWFWELLSLKKNMSEFSAVHFLAWRVPAVCGFLVLRSPMCIHAMHINACGDFGFLFY